MCVLDGSGGVCGSPDDDGDPGEPISCGGLVRTLDCRTVLVRFATELARWRPVDGESVFTGVTDVAGSDESPAAL